MCWVEVSAVPAVYQRDAGKEGGSLCAALKRMAHGDDIGIAADDFNRILKLSPFATEEFMGLSNPIVWPPNRSIAV